MAIRATDSPCQFCPYRKDVPSGVWDESEYRKLPPYDAATSSQPPGIFMCHAREAEMCRGWFDCHDRDESLSLRLAITLGIVDRDHLLDPVSSVPLHESGALACEFGLRDIDDPSPAAMRAMESLARMPRLEQE